MGKFYCYLFISLSSVVGEFFSYIVLIRNSSKPKSIFHGVTLILILMLLTLTLSDKDLQI